MSLRVVKMRNITKSKVKKVTKAIFPVAGMGTRFLPATKAIPKEIMTLVDRPLIQYAIDEARAAGIKEFIFVTARGKSALEDYFDHSPELEAALRRSGFRDCTEKPGIGRFLWSDEDVMVEFLTPREDITGFSDQWYPEVLRSAIRTRGIWHASAPAFIATKISAFLDGRRGDFYSSKDIEDILAVIDGRASVVTELKGAEPELRHWLTHSSAVRPRSDLGFSASQRTARAL